MRGIILAGGNGTRLYPITKSVSKQLLPVYDKPMIYYPISLLMLAGIRVILIIGTPEGLPAYKKLLGTGEKWGLFFQYEEQDAPRGLPEAFTIGSDFIGSDDVCLVLGDNIFYGENLASLMRESAELDEGGIIFAYHVKDPNRYAVVEFDDEMNILSIEEKPKHPKSEYAVPGIYFFDNDVVEISKNLKPSARQETEIVDIFNEYFKRGKLQLKKMGRGVAWLDAGTFDSLLQASAFVQTIQERQGMKIADLDEIASTLGYV
jgi:glucose-1-phosphate thymidylyltransferase